LILSWYFDQLAAGKTEKACADIVRLFAGFSRSELRKIAEASAEDELKSDFTKRRLGRYTLPKGIRFIGESVALLRGLRRARFDVWVISGSSRWGVAAVLKRLRLPSNRIIGIDLVEVDKTLSSSVKRPVPVLKGKVSSLKHVLRTRPEIVVSDSKYDIALFNYSADSKVLIHSNNGRASRFFSEGRINRDDSWAVIERPTLLP
jgi:phosphoserine phosphatase